MNPEERFQKIENALNAIAEHQSHNELAIGKLSVSMDRLVDIVGGLADAQVDAQAAAAAAAARHDAEIAEIREIQKSSDYKLNALIDAVDKIVRDRRG
jgi:hypothetical protein